MDALLTLAQTELVALADALASGRLSLPATGFAVQRVLGRLPSFEVVEALGELASSDAAAVLRLLARARMPLESAELVWSGPDTSHTLRSTRTVITELFKSATTRVLLAGFAVVHGEDVFAELAARMDVVPELDVRFFLNVHRRPNASPAETVSWFADDFRKRVWPGARLPSVFYDPRSMADDAAERAVLHAKCVVVDGREALITSANFTPHAQERNIELGVRLREPKSCALVESQLSGLVDSGVLVRML